MQAEIPRPAWLRAPLARLCCFRSMLRLKRILSHATAASPAAGTGPSPSEQHTRPTVQLSSESAALAIDLAGGSIGSFVLLHGAAGQLNPLTWNQPPQLHWRE